MWLKITQAGLRRFWSMLFEPRPYGPLGFAALHWFAGLLRPPAACAEVEAALWRRARRPQPGAGSRDH